MKQLVAYFSATGITAGVANSLADAIGADVLEIRPAQVYSPEDLNWWEETSRSTLEMKDPKARPEISRSLPQMGEYSRVYVGFPIWWGVAPRIINSFLESYDFGGVTLIPFATSGGSGAEKVRQSLADSAKGARLLEASLLKPDAGYQALSDWADTKK